MAVERPVAGRISGEDEAGALGGLDGEGVLQRQAARLAVFQLDQKSMQVDRVLHHGVVDQDDADGLVEGDADRRGLGELEAVKAPGPTLHIAGQMQQDLAAGRQRRSGNEWLQVGIGQGSAIVAVEAAAGLGYAVGRARGHIVDIDHALEPGRRRVGRRVHLHPGHILHARNHAHVGHAALGPRIHRRDRASHARLRGEGGAGIAAAVLGLGEDRVGPVLPRLDDQVVGLARADAQLLHLDRLDVRAVGGDHRQHQPLDAQVEQGHGRAVDHP